MSQVSGPVADYIDNGEREPLIVTRNGTPYAAIILYEDLTALQHVNDDRDILSPEEGEHLLSYLERVRAKYRVSGGSSLEEVRKRLGISEG